MKKLIGLAAITGVVVFAYVRSLGTNAGSKLLPESDKKDALVA